MIVVLVVEPGLVHQLWLWPVLAAITAVAMWDLRSTYLAAGTDWLQTRGGRWVDTYRLTRITVAAGNAQLHVHLDDADGRRLVLSDKVLLANPALWALVYNGIRHSHADGADLAGVGRHNLKLPEDGREPGRPA